MSDNSIFVEGEGLLPAPPGWTVNGSAEVQRNCCGLAFSGDGQLLFRANGPGGQVSNEITVQQRGYYEMTVRHTLAPDY